jgi:hypothetical protein
LSRKRRFALVFTSHEVSIGAATDFNLEKLYDLLKSAFAFVTVGVFLLINFGLVEVTSTGLDP